jgi:hypothetical protein
MKKREGNFPLFCARIASSMGWVYLDPVAGI